MQEWPASSCTVRWSGPAQARDHLRNHGFVLGKTGWRLAPAFDVNPNIDKAEHVLNIDDVDNRPSLETILSTAAFYGLDDMQARQIMNEIVTVVGSLAGRCSADAHQRCGY